MWGQINPAQQKKGGWYLRDDGLSFGVQSHAERAHPEAAHWVLRLHIPQECGFQQGASPQSLALGRQFREARADLRKV